MINRTWHGWTTPENADTYETLLLNQILPGIAAMNIPGYLGVHVLRRDVQDGDGRGEVEFVTMMWFESLDNVKDFVSGDHEVAYVPDEARAVLSRIDLRSNHYDVVLQPS